MARSIKALFCALVLVGFTGMASAQTGPIGNQPQPGPNMMIYKGTEDLQGFGDLQFNFHRGGRVQMLDASKKVVEGKGSAVGNRITITFSNCVYEGVDQMDPQTGRFCLVGTARFTSGNEAGQTWNFRVYQVTNPAIAQR